MADYNPAEVSFARRVAPTSEQFAAVLPPEFTGLADNVLLAFSPLIEDRINAAIFTFKDGDRSGKPIATVAWRVNANPTANAPSAWIDFPSLPLALWYDHQRGFYSIQKSQSSLAKVREYEF